MKLMSRAQNFLLHVYRGMTLYLVERPALRNAVELTLIHNLVGLGYEQCEVHQHRQRRCQTVFVGSFFKSQWLRIRRQ